MGRIEGQRHTPTGPSLRVGKCWAPGQLTTFTGDLAGGQTGNRRIRAKPVVPRKFNLPFQDEPRRDVFVTGTVDYLSGCKSALFLNCKSSRHRNLDPIQDG